jgi:hypothetical protein
VDVGIPGEGGDLTVGGGPGWARGSNKLLARIDLKRNRVVGVTVRHRAVAL